MRRFPRCVPANRYTEDSPSLNLIAVIVFAQFFTILIVGFIAVRIDAVVVAVVFIRIDSSAFCLAIV